MPDWKALVRKRMESESLGLGPAPEEEIVCELASHLEDCCEELGAQGFCKSEAIELLWNRWPTGPACRAKFDVRNARRK
jgi:hypothetical protein